MKMETINKTKNSIVIELTKENINKILMFEQLFKEFTVNKAACVVDIMNCSKCDYPFKISFINEEVDLKRMIENKGKDDVAIIFKHKCEHCGFITKYLILNYVENTEKNDNDQIQ